MTTGSRLRRLFLALFLATSAIAQVPLGATKQEVINLIGWPASSSRAGGREILNYPDFTVVLEKNQMTNLYFKPGKNKPLSSYLVSPPKKIPAISHQNHAALATAVSNSTPTNSRPYVPRPSVVQPISPDQPRRAVAPIDPFAQVKTRITWMLGLFVVFAGLKIWFRGAAEKRRLETGEFSPPPPRRGKEGVPPLILSRRQSPPDSEPERMPTEWSMTLLKAMEWHRFEHVVAAYERELGNDAELTDFGPDGGIDVRVFEKNDRVLKRLIQCKAFGAQQVGVELVRSFFGVMTLEKCPQGAFYTTSSFTDAALAIGLAEPTIELVDGATFLNRIQRLKLSAQLRLLEVATNGDYKTPTCPSCGVKMVLRTARNGRNAGNDFWACPQYRCGQIINLRRH